MGVMKMISVVIANDWTSAGTTARLSQAFAEKPGSHLTRRVKGAALTPPAVFGAVSCWQATTCADPPTGPAGPCAFARTTGVDADILRAPVALRWTLSGYAHSVESQATCRSGAWGMVMSGSFPVVGETLAEAVWRRWERTVAFAS